MFARFSVVSLIKMFVSNKSLKKERERKKEQKGKKEREKEKKKGHWT
jgi:choline-glycine betaine transporter